MDLRDFLKYLMIERSEIKLTPIQYKMIMTFIDGDSIQFPTQSGKTFVANLIRDYVEYKLSNN